MILKLWTLKLWEKKRAAYLFPMTDTDILTQNLTSVHFSYKTTAHTLSSRREKDIIRDISNLDSGHMGVVWLVWLLCCAALCKSDKFGPRRNVQDAKATLFAWAFITSPSGKQVTSLVRHSASIPMSQHYHEHLKRYTFLFLSPVISALIFKLLNPGNIFFI